MIRIDFASSAFQAKTGEAGFAELLKILAARGSLTALIKRITPTTLILEDAGAELVLPLAIFADQKKSLLPGGTVEIERRGESNLAFNILPPAPKTDATADAKPVFSSLEEHVAGLGFKADEQSVGVAQVLLELGYPLEEDLLRALLPFAERGELEEALILLEARFPLRHSLIEVVKHLRAGGARQKSFAQATELSADVKEILSRRAAFSALKTLNTQSSVKRTLFQERIPRALLKAVSQLLVQERLLEALAAQGGQDEFILALPFILGDELHACWLRIGEDQNGDEGPPQEESSFRIELEIPTASLGTVGARLVVSGKNVLLNLELTDPNEAIWSRAAQEFKEELETAGWLLAGVELGRWPNAKSSRFAL